MWNIFRNEKDDKLADLLIMLLEDGGLEGFAEKQARYVVLEQEKVRAKTDNERVYEKFIYLDRLKNLNMLEEENVKEYEYVKFLVEFRGLGDDK